MESVCEDADVIAQNIVVRFVSFYSIQKKLFFKKPKKNIYNKLFDKFTWPCVCVKKWLNQFGK